MQEDLRNELDYAKEQIPRKLTLVEVELQKEKPLEALKLTQEGIRYLQTLQHMIVESVQTTKTA